MNEPIRDSMDAGEAAALLHVHVETLRRLARRKRVPAFKVGKDWRFSRAALARWSRQDPVASGAAAVLVIDDDDMARKALAGPLLKAGYRVLSADSGARGLELVESASPGVVLLDLRMPGMHGPEFLRRLRQTRPSLPVVVVTGYPDGALMHEASRYPPLLLLPKPADAAQLRDTVALALGLPAPGGRP